MQTQAVSRRGSWRHRTTLLAVWAVAGLLQCVPLSAQRYGQWWWSAKATYRGSLSQYDVESSNPATRDDGLQLRLAFHGYLVHPLIGSWELGVDSDSATSRSGSDVASDGLGYSASLSLFPAGTYPTSIAFSQQNFDIRIPDNPALAPSFISRQTSTSAGFRARAGRLRGLILNFRGNRVEFEDDRTRPQEFQDLTLRWSRSGPSTTTRVSARWDAQDYGEIGSTRDALRTQVDQNGETAGGWNWSLSLDGEEERLGSRGTRSTAQDLRASGTTQGTVRERDSVSLGFNTAWSQANDVTAQAFGGNFSYRWRPGRAVELSPRIGAVRFERADSQRTLTNGGLGFAWSRSLGRVSYRLTLDSGMQRTDPGADGATQESLTYNASLSLSSRPGSGLAKSLDLRYFENELSFERLEVDTTDEAPLIAELVESETGTRVRAGLSGATRRLRTDFWAAWTNRDVLFFGGSQATSQSAQSSLGIQLGDFGLTLGAGRTEFDQQASPPFFSRYASVNGSWRPLRILRFDAVVRQDEQNGRQLPSFAQRQTELRSEFGWGLLTWNLSFYQVEDRLEGRAPRTSRGVRWSITRGFAGWLPIASAIERRGVIR